MVKPKLTQSGNIMIKYFLSTLALLFTTQAFATDITASVNRNPVLIDESFSLIITSKGDVDGEPDLQPLVQDFKILGTSQSNSMNYINGKFNRQTQWRIDLLSKKTGDITIPSLAFGKDSSPSLRISVVATPKDKQKAENQNVFMEIDTDVKQTWVQSQIIYTIRIFHKVAIKSGSLSNVTTNDSDAIIEKLGDDKNFEVLRNGTRYEVIERRYAIFPQRSGKLTIKPVLFEAFTGGRSSFSMFNGMGGNVVRLNSKAASVEVKPVPASIQPDQWLPAQKLLIGEEWSQDKDELKIGEPVTRTITLYAHGLLANQLPNITFDDIDGVKQYSDQPVVQNKIDKSGVVSSKQIKLALIPSQSGTMTLPEIRIAWWNTKTGKQEIASIAPAMLNVHGEITPTKETPEPLTDNTADAQQQTNNTPTLQTAESLSNNYWPWVSLALAISWLLTLLLLLRTRISRTGANKQASVKKLFAQALSACNNNDANHSKDALLNWAQAKWPEHRIHSLMNLVTHVDTSTANAIRELNATLYRKHDADWDGSNLANSLKQLNTHLKSDTPIGIYTDKYSENTNKSTDLIEPLYKA